MNQVVVSSEYLYNCVCLCVEWWFLIFDYLTVYNAWNDDKWVCISDSDWSTILGQVYGQKVARNQHPNEIAFIRSNCYNSCSWTVLQPVLGWIMGSLQFYYWCVVFNPDLALAQISRITNDGRQRQRVWDYTTNRKWT